MIAYIYLRIQYTYVYTELYIRMYVFMHVCTCSYSGTVYVVLHIRIFTCYDFAYVHTFIMYIHMYICALS